MVDFHPLSNIIYYQLLNITNLDSSYFPIQAFYKIGMFHLQRLNCLIKKNTVVTILILLLYTYLFKGVSKEGWFCLLTLLKLLYYLLWWQQDRRLPRKSFIIIVLHLITTLLHCHYLFLPFNIHSNASLKTQSQ